MCHADHENRKRSSSCQGQRHRIYVICPLCYGIGHESSQEAVMGANASNHDANEPRQGGAFAWHHIYSQPFVRIFHKSLH